LIGIKTHVLNCIGFSCLLLMEVLSGSISRVFGQLNIIKKRWERMPTKKSNKEVFCK